MWDDLGWLSFFFGLGGLRLSYSNFLASTVGLWNVGESSGFCWLGLTLLFRMAVYHDVKVEWIQGGEVLGNRREPWGVLGKIRESWGYEVTDPP